MGLSGTESSWAWTGENSRAIATASAAMAAIRMGNRRLSVRIIMAPPCACAGVWDAAHPLRRRQPIAARRACGVAWLKAVPGECGTCEAHRKASFEDTEGFGRVLSRERRWVGTGPAGMSRRRRGS